MVAPGQQPKSPRQEGVGSPPPGMGISLERWNAMTPAERWAAADAYSKWTAAATKASDGAWAGAAAAQAYAGSAGAAGGGGSAPAPSGGGGWSGAAAAAAYGGNAAAAANPPIDEQTIRDRYPQLSWMLDDPELKGILTLAAAAGWDSSRLQGALYNTNWWQTHSATARQWTQLLNQDPAAARQRIIQESTSIIGLARQWGMDLSDNQAFEISVNKIQFGWDEAQLHKVLGREMRAIVKDPHRQLTGMARSRVDAYKALGAQYLLPISDRQGAEYAIREFEGSSTEEGIVASYVKQAKARFGYLADELDRGVTVADYFEPVRQSVAQRLEVSPEDINLLQGKWSKIADYTDPNTGKVRGMSITEAENYARRQKEWQTTANAHEEGAALVNRITETFGQVAR